MFECLPYVIYDLPLTVHIGLSLSVESDDCWAPDKIAWIKSEKTPLQRAHLFFIDTNNIVTPYLLNMLFCFPGIQTLFYGPLHRNYSRIWVNIFNIGRLVSADNFIYVRILPVCVVKLNDLKRQVKSLYIMFVIQFMCTSKHNNYFTNWKWWIPLKATILMKTIFNVLVDKYLKKIWTKLKHENIIYGTTMCIYLFLN